MVRLKGASHPNLCADLVWTPEGHGLPTPRVCTGGLILSGCAKVLKHFAVLVKLVGISAADRVKFTRSSHP